MSICPAGSIVSSGAIISRCDWRDSPASVLASAVSCHIVHWTSACWGETAHWRIITFSIPPDQSKWRWWIKYPSFECPEPYCYQVPRKCNLESVHFVCRTMFKSLGYHENHFQHIVRTYTGARHGFYDTKHHNHWNLHQEHWQILCRDKSSKTESCQSCESRFSGRVLFCYVLLPYWMLTMRSIPCKLDGCIYPWQQEKRYSAVESCIWLCHWNLHLLLISCWLGLATSEIWITPQLEGLVNES